MLQVEGVLHLAVFYQAAAENGGVCAFGAEVPFQHSLNLGGDPDTRVRCRVLVQSVDASWQGGHKIRTNVQCQLEVTAARVQNVQVLQEVSLEPMNAEELSRIPSMALYVVQPCLLYTSRCV